MPITTERRNRTRTRPPGLVYAELGPSNGGMMRDLSEEGFAMRAMMPLRVGDITPFTLQLDAIIRLEGQCQVVWVKEEGRLMGLRFVDNSSKIRGQIRSWLALPDELLPPDNHSAPAEPHQPSTMEELRKEMRSIGPREESPHEDLKILQPPVPIEPAPSIPPQVLPPEMQSLPEPESAPAAAEHAIPSLPPLELENHLPPLEAQLGTPNQHNEILALSSLTQEPEATSHFQSLAPPLEPLSILEKRNSPRPTESSWLGNFTLSAAIGIMLCIALLISGFVFHQELGQLLIWLGQKIAGTESVQAPPPVESQNSPVVSAPANENPEPQNPGKESPGVNPDVGKGTDFASLAENLPKQNPAGQTLATPQKQSQIPPALTPMTQTNKPTPAPAISAPAASPSSAPGATNSEAGYQEFQAARAILRSDSREAELPDAVRLLWASVEKGNTGAEVALAELYRTGRGVSKNCDQARILLTAAANRGNSDAKHELANLTAEGCR